MFIDDHFCRAISLMRSINILEVRILKEELNKCCPIYVIDLYLHLVPWNEEMLRKLAHT